MLWWDDPENLCTGVVKVPRDEWESDALMISIKTQNGVGATAAREQLREPEEYEMLSSIEGLTPELLLWAKTNADIDPNDPALPPPPLPSSEQPLNLEDPRQRAEVEGFLASLVTKALQALPVTNDGVWGVEIRLTDYTEK
jgi:hypothetical protein